MVMPRKWANRTERNRESNRRRRERESLRPRRVLTEEHKAAIVAGQKRGHAERAAAKLSPQAERERRRKIYPDSEPAIAAYREEKRRKALDLMPLLLEAKAQLQREDDALKFARRGGRPKKVVNG